MRGGILERSSETKRLPSAKSAMVCSVPLLRAVAALLAASSTRTLPSPILPAASLPRSGRPSTPHGAFEHGHAPFSEARMSTTGWLRSRDVDSGRHEAAGARHSNTPRQQHHHHAATAPPSRVYRLATDFGCDPTGVADASPCFARALAKAWADAVGTNSSNQQGAPDLAGAT